MSSRRPSQLSLPLDIRCDAPLKALPRVSQTDLDQLHRAVSNKLGEPLDLVGTNNRRSMISWRRDTTGFLQLRIQRQFALGGPKVHSAVALFIRNGDRSARKILGDYARGFQSHMARSRPRYAAPAGRFHDLRHHVAEQNRLRLNGAFSGRIGWSVGTKGRSRKSIRLGSFSEEHQLIRIHPVLDSRDVPGFVVGFIVFHEMLHGVLGLGEKNSRARAHGPEFRRRERAHPDHGRAELWIQRNLDSLLCY